MASQADGSAELDVLRPGNSMDDTTVLPQPLQIIKRRESRPIGRKFSIHTDDSLGSLPEAPGSQKNINVYKKRGIGCTHTAEGSCEEGITFSPSCSSPHWDCGISSSSSFRASIEATVEGPDASTLSLALSNFSSSSFKTPYMARGKYLLKKAIGRLDKDHSQRHKSDSRPIPPGSIQPRTTGHTRSCYDLRGAVDSASLISKESIDPDRHLHESILEKSRHGKEASVLMPQVVVTPEVKALDGKNGDLWIAVQIFGKVCCARDAHEKRSPEFKEEATYEDASCCRSTYGHLYGLRVELLATPYSNILEVVGNPDTPRTMYLNSRMLILVHVSLSSSPPPATWPQIRQRSDELMADLEFHLSSIKTEYLIVRLSYSHSTFPDINNIVMTDGVARVENKIVTTATAVIKRLNSSSLWSPPPAPTPNPLFEIISSHWGPVRTADLVGRIVGPSRNIPGRRTENKVRIPLYSPNQLEHSIFSLPISDDFKAPEHKIVQVPIRKASLKRTVPAPLIPTSLFDSENPEDSSYLEDKDYGEEDPARKIWTEMRKASRGTNIRVVGRGSFRISKPGIGGRPTSPSVNRITAGPKLSPKSARREAERMREALLERAIRNKRSLGGDTLRSLVPSFERASLESYVTGSQDVPDNSRYNGNCTMPKTRHADGRQRAEEEYQVGPNQVPRERCGDGTNNPQANWEEVYDSIPIKTMKNSGNRASILSDSNAITRQLNATNSSARKRLSWGWGWGSWWS